MTNRYEGVKCPVCNGYLFEDADDIVVCPICGAPHHRECYKSLGHCGVEELHGTEQQYDKTHSFKNSTDNTDRAESLCKGCGKPMTNDMLFCPHCGKMRGETVNEGPEQGYIFYKRLDPLGGVHPTTDLGDGVTAKQAADFIKVNTTRYIPKFASTSKASWNWLAFILPYSFFFYRKMHKVGAIVSAIYVSAIILGLPMQAEVLELMATLPINPTVQDMFSILMQNSQAVSGTNVLLYGISLVLILILRIVCGIFADNWYKNHVIESVKKYDALEPELRAQKYIKKGLPNIYLFFFVTLGFYWLPNILSLICF